jgi:hypothetical protein
MGKLTRADGTTQTMADGEHGGNLAESALSAEAGRIPPGSRRDNAPPGIAVDKRPAEEPQVVPVADVVVVKPRTAPKAKRGE